MKTDYEKYDALLKFVGFTVTSETLINAYFKSFIPFPDLDEGDIMRVVGNDYKIPPERMLIHAKPAPICEPRQVSMMLIYSALQYSDTETGWIFKKHRTTILRAVRTIRNFYDTNREFRQRFTRIIFELGIDIEVLKKDGKWVEHPTTSASRSN